MIKQNNNDNRLKFSVVDITIIEIIAKTVSKLCSHTNIVLLYSSLYSISSTFILKFFFEVDYYLPVSFHKGVQDLRLALFSLHISRNDFLLWEEASIFHKKNNYFDDLHNFTRQHQCLFTIMIAAQPLIKKTLWLIEHAINYVIASLAYIFWLSPVTADQKVRSSFCIHCFKKLLQENPVSYLRYHIFFFSTKNKRSLKKQRYSFQLHGWRRKIHVI